MRTLALLAVLATFLAAAMAAPPAHAASFKLVVHSSNPVRSLSRDQISKIFLKKVTRWNDGGETRPVDLDDESRTREALSETIHGKDVASVKSYWQKMIFSGRATPPPELSSDAEVLAFVRSNPGAIGYVSAATSVGSGVAVVEIED